MAVPVIGIDTIRYWANLPELELNSHRFRLIRNVRHQIVRAYQIKHHEAATPRRHTSRAGDCGVDERVRVGQVYALRNARGGWI